MSTDNYKKINNLIALVCTFALIIVIASIISKLIWQFLDKNDTVTISELLDNSAKTQEELALPLDLFGVLDAPVTQNHSQIASTRLNLTLIGILYKENHPFVIVKQEGGNNKIYQINDFITPSTILKEVFSQYVILEHNGNIEKLVMKRNSIDLAKKSSQSGIQISASNRSKLKYYLEELKTNPQNLTEVLSVQPNYNNEELRGFIISPGREKALFEELGFQKNDIILIINNNELNNLSQAIEIRKELAEQQTFDFIIERKGQIHYLTLNLN